MYIRIFLQTLFPMAIKNNNNNKILKNVIENYVFRDIKIQLYSIPNCDKQNMSKLWTILDTGSWGGGDAFAPLALGYGPDGPIRSC